MTFDFGESDHASRFFRKFPQFIVVFPRFIELSNVAFGRPHRPQNRLQDIAFSLGHTCRDDFLDVVFSSVHGRREMATKLIRPLFEKALAIAYMIKHPDAAERFVRYAAIQEHRMLEAALLFAPEDQINERLKGTTSISQIREFYEQIRPEFKETVCKKCGKERLKGSWDVDVTTMVRDVGEPYSRTFFLAYVIPNQSIHATLASTWSGKEPAPEEIGPLDVNLILALDLMTEVMRSQDQVFSLGIEQRLSDCVDSFKAIWPEIE